MLGSSPHARGLRLLGLALWVARRIIPARAGFTQRLGGKGQAFRDHPRTRGVYHHYGYHHTPVGWIIPARAGFTDLHNRGVEAHSDHPRTRGVYVARSLASSASVGSSPHARGLHWGDDGQSHQNGIIPARAGFT